MRQAEQIPDRLRWAVQVLDADPGSAVLEIGCGPGVAVALVCDRLSSGQVTAIDRSPTAIQRAAARNAEHIAAGKARFHVCDLADLPADGAQFDVAFAVNVNLFWVRSPDPELRILRRRLRGGGVLRLFYEVPAAAKAAQIAEAVATALIRNGFSATTTTGPAPELVCISGLLAEEKPRDHEKQRDP